MYLQGTHLNLSDREKAFKIQNKKRQIGYQSYFMLMRKHLSWAFPN